MEYLTKEDIVLVNSKTIKRHGGHFVPPSNFLNEPPLDYLVDAVQAEMFDSPLYPEIYDKSGVYMFNIISNHVFQDGNKRTGLGAVLLFLRLNGFGLLSTLKKIPKSKENTIPEQGESSNEILIEFTLEVAAGKISLEECQSWFKENIVRGEEIILFV